MVPISFCFILYRDVCRQAVRRPSGLTLLISLILNASLSAQTFTVVTESVIAMDGKWTDGGSWGDYNNDGYLDLFVAHSGGIEFLDGATQPNCLYTNNGDGTFTPVTGGDIVTTTGLSTAAVWGDYDEDGDLDIFISDEYPAVSHNSLYRNDGGAFTEISLESPNVQSFGAAWGDLDRDGDLDLLVANLGFSLNFLYLNNGDGTLTRVTTGEIVNESFPGQSNCVNWVDYDNDGDLDLFMANEFGSSGYNNFLYANDGDGTFKKITEGPIVNDGGSSSGSSWGDYDNDGDLDLYVTNVGFENHFLYANNGDGTFRRITEGLIVNDPVRSLGGSWGDFDNDGDLDIYITTRSEQTPDYLYSNNGDGTFVRSSVLSTPIAWGCAAGDYDNDGDLDLFVAGFARPDAEEGQWVPENDALLNNQGNSNHWVNINCVGLATKTPRMGTKVRIKATIAGGAMWQMREISGQTGAGSQNSLRVHFGLGDATVIDSMKIEWLSGSVDVYTNVEADKFYRAVQGSGLIPIVTSIAEMTSGLPDGFELSQNYPNPFNPQTTIGYRLAVSSRVMLSVYNLLGNEIAILVGNELQQAGSHTIAWAGTDAFGNNVASGIYLVKLQAGSFVQTRKIVLVR